jgi:hypothetical protein
MPIKFFSRSEAFMEAEGISKLMGTKVGLLQRAYRLPHVCCFSAAWRGSRSQSCDKLRAIVFSLVVFFQALSFILFPKSRKPRLTHTHINEKVMVLYIQIFRSLKSRQDGNFLTQYQQIFSVYIFLLHFGNEY